MSKTLIGKVALVTGGSRSIGAVNVKGLFVALFTCWKAPS
jgi:NAD(P)-dependent dehydrogenase (short-subunit alcohol dehydrogenase family)